MDKIKPMHNKTVPANGLPVVTDLTKVDDPSIGDMVLKNNSGTLDLQIFDGTQWCSVNGGNDKPAIWVLDPSNTTTTELVANKPITLTADVANKFKAVEVEYTGDLKMLSPTNLTFTSAREGDYEFEVRGVVEDASNTVSKVAFSLLDDTTNAPLTGSLWTQPTAFAWGSAIDFSVNCTGVVRMSANSSITLQAISDVKATVTIKSLIVKMTKIG